MQTTTQHTKRLFKGYSICTLLPLLLGALHGQVEVDVLASAEFDECVYGIYSVEETALGQNLNTYQKSGLTEEEVAACYASEGLAKRNQAYAWSMKKKGDQLWWGTGPNINSLVSGSYFGGTGASLPRDGGQVAEGSTSKFAVLGVVDEENDIDYGYKVFGGFGDFRPPNIYKYDLDTDELQRLDLSLRPEDTALLWKTLGLRSTGYTAPIRGYPEGIVFFAGPSVAPSTLHITESLPEPLGINIFAFDAATGECIGSKNFPEYSNIRKWKEHDGQLYTTVANQDGTGQVLKHNRNRFLPGFPFNFTNVGNLASGGAEIEFYEGRLFVNTWPGIEGNFDLGPENFQQILNIINGPASLYRSPLIPPGGLNALHANRWSIVWSAVDYDPDIAISLHYGGGAMAVFDGHLYWGTTHVAGSAQIANQIVYGTPTQPVREDYGSLRAYLAAYARYTVRLQQDLINPLRYISIWRGKNFSSSTGDIEMLYGNNEMPCRIRRSTFMRNGDPRGDFDILKWGFFLLGNLGKLGEITDGEEVTLWSIPLFFGRSFDIKTTMEDGGDWEIIPNVGGYEHIHGKEGVLSISLDAETLGLGSLFGEFNISGNFYTWSMETFDNKLYFGTLDVAGGLLSFLNSDFENGADLFCFPDGDSPAELVSNNALGNPYAYGLRNLEADEERKVLYVGTANPSNLRNSESLAKLLNQPNNNDGNIFNNDFSQDLANGGWEVLRVSFPESVTTEALPEVLSDSAGPSDEWLIGTEDPSTSTIAFTSVSPDATGRKAFAWESFPGIYYTLYSATGPEAQWSPVQTYVGTGGTLDYEWDASSSDVQYLKVVESKSTPADAL